MSESEKAQALEDEQHAAVMRVLKSHFGHSAVECDMEDAAWSILSALDEYPEPAK